MRQRHRKRPTKRFAWWLTVRQRWSNTMPKFFKVILCVSALISGTALAVNTAIVAGGGVTHEWWNEVYPYLLGIPAGAAFVAKFTQTYGKDGEPVGKKPKADASGTAADEDDSKTIADTTLDKDDF